MSAFVCTDRHIATVARTYAQLDGRSLTEAAELANLLKRENIRSVNYRYHRRDKLVPCNLQEAIEIDRFGGRLTIADVLELLHCLEYQSCERHDFKRSAACAAMRAIAAALEPIAKPPKSGMWRI